MRRRHATQYRRSPPSTRSSARPSDASSRRSYAHGRTSGNRPAGSPTRCSGGSPNSATSASSSPGIRRRRRPGRGCCVRRGARLVRIRRSRRGHRSPCRNRAASDLEVRHRGPEAALSRARDPRRADRCAGHHRARRRLGRRGGPDARTKGGRRICRERVEDVHHRRGPRRRDRDRRQDDPRWRAPRAVVPD